MTDPLAEASGPSVTSDARIALCAAEGDLSQAARAALERRYNTVPPERADVIVALGGDGFMLETLHRFMAQGIPVFGMNRGTIGFLMNGYAAEGLRQRLAKAQAVTLYPLRMAATTIDGGRAEALAINEVSLFREERQTAKIQIDVDGVTRLEELMCDGVLVATSAGSTAYNLSAYGPILPLGANVLALTPISAFRPRRWRGAILPEHARITFDILEARKRPVAAVADFTEVRDVTRVDVHEDRSCGITLLFDPEHNLEERVLKEQFAT